MSRRLLLLTLLAHLLVLDRRQSAEAAYTYVYVAYYTYYYSPYTYYSSSYVSIGAIVGSVIGALSFIGFIIGLVICLCCIRKRRMLAQQRTTIVQVPMTTMAADGTVAPVATVSGDMSGYPKPEGMYYGGPQPPPYPMADAAAGGYQWPAGGAAAAAGVAPYPQQAQYPQQQVYQPPPPGYQPQQPYPQEPMQHQPPMQHQQPMQQTYQQDQRF